MFFTSFPTTTFAIDEQNQVIVTDFIRAIKIDSDLKEDSVFFDIYEVQDGETPEVISHKVYKSTQYHWVIMAVNERFDPWRDFPQSDYVILKMSADKYADINGLHHYEDANGNWVDEFAAEKIPVTNIEYERKENDAKRSLKILKPEILADFVDSYKSLIAI
jgi:Base plate wedge protein 53